MIKARISRQQILNNIPEQYRHYFNINISDIDQDLYPLLKILRMRQIFCVNLLTSIKK